ncbi:hypothetical protein CRG98_006721 [Punica granatum]|uniref:Uncharacterized protein n=1 Tax=Punica granatum TaxID=22663 RepID=A0A2I0KWX3_PUNGR|nr:hypothetical protein CRG98_006721 [Punica granatum]
MPTIEEYQTLIGQTAVARGIVESNFHATRPTLVSHLFRLLTTRLCAELAYFGESIISRLLPLVRVDERKISEWVKNFRKIPPGGFKWRSAWMLPERMALRCFDFHGVLLRTVVIERPYFPERLTQEEWDFHATEEYVLRFYQWSPPTHEELLKPPHDEGGTQSGAPLPWAWPFWPSSLA